MTEKPPPPTPYLSNPFPILISGLFSPQGLVLDILLSRIFLSQKPHGALHFIYTFLDLSKMYLLYLEIYRFVLYTVVL